MADFNSFWEDLKKGITSLAENSFNDFKEQALAAGNDFIEQSKDDLKVWTEQLATGQINQKDFEWNVKSKETTAKLIILKQEGLAKANVDKLTSGLFNVVISTAVKTFLA